MSMPRITINSLNHVLLATAVTIGCFAATKTSAQTRTTDPRTFTSQAGRFSIAMTNPAYEALPQSTGTNDVQHQFVSGSAEGVMMVAYQDHDSQNVTTDSAQENAYRQFAIAFVKSVRGKVQTYDEITSNQLRGRQFECDLPRQGGKSRSRMFWVNQRFYHVLVMGMPSFVASEKANVFLESFDATK